jgi:hypothetical protein
MWPGTARGDWLFTPFLGWTFAGSTAVPELEEGAAGTAHAVYGGSVGWWSPGVIGIEADFGYVPGFFERNNLVVTSSHVATLSFDVVLATPVVITRESLRPYLVGGVGWMRASIDEIRDVFPEIYGRARNSLGVNVGGGAVGFITPRTGLRFELRQFRSLERFENPLDLERGSVVSFWRATVGVVLQR